MIRSMTGFGRGEYVDDISKVTVEVKSVNHRYLDIFVKMPRRYSFAEESIKTAIKERVYRGKTEVCVSIDNIGKSDTDIMLDKDLATKYYNALSELGYKILNVITWQKTNPPPNLSCRYFTFSTEFIIWARREKKVPHYFNYDLMHELAGGRQMRDVWTLPAIGKWEKTFGKHPTQKPLALLIRILLASTKLGEWIIDPFAGSCTTGIAAKLLGRRFFGIDLSSDFLSLGVNRFQEAETVSFQQKAKRLVADLQNMHEPESAREEEVEYGRFPCFFG